MKKNKLLVTKSNTLVEAGYRLSLDEQRLLLLAIGQVESRDSVVSRQDLFTISAREFSIFTNGDTSNSYRSIKAASEDLFERRITFWEKETGSVLVTRWVSSVKYNENEGTVSLRFAQDVLPLLTQIKGYFTQYNLENISKLTSVHSIRIYEICLQYLSNKWRDIPLDEFRYLLGIEDQYLEFKALNQWVIKPSIEQINKYTDIKISVTAQRLKRRVIALKFKIESRAVGSVKSSPQKAQDSIRGVQLELDVEIVKKPNNAKKKASFVIGEVF